MNPPDRKQARTQLVEALKNAGIKPVDRGVDFAPLDFIKVAAEFSAQRGVQPCDLATEDARQRIADELRREFLKQVHHSEKLYSRGAVDAALKNDRLRSGRCAPLRPQRWRRHTDVGTRQRMALQALIARFGLGAVFLGAGLEGETAVIAGGVLAHQQILSLPGVAIAGALGSFVADQGFFLLGRHFRDNRRVQKILDKPAAEHALETLERHPIAFILGFRFLYGLRSVSPVAVGTSDVPQGRFLALNALAAALWALLFTGIGYGVGGPLGRYFHSKGSVVPLLIGGLLVFGIGLFLVRTAWNEVRDRRTARAGREHGRRDDKQAR